MAKNTQLLAPLPDKPYQVMSAFISQQYPKLVDQGRRISKNWAERSTVWSDPRTGQSERISKGSLRLDKAYDSVVNHPSGAIIQRQLLIHDFFGQINKFGLESFQRTSWVNGQPWRLSTTEEKRRLKMWKDGKTGYSIVDSAMAELRSEGFICNRLRMTVASYLTKNMLVSWHLGEDYFHTQLIDYGDGASNKGNWLWVSGAGYNARLTDVINPLIQAKKTDPDYTLRGKYGFNRDDEGKLRPEFEYQLTKDLWLKKAT